MALATGPFFDYCQTSSALRAYSEYHYMKFSIPILSLIVLLTSCEKQSPPASGFKFTHVDYQNSDFSEWMTESDQQMAFDSKSNDSYFAYTEGRNNGGLNQYRFVLKPIPKERASEWAAFWGLTPDEFDKVDLQMLKNGFVRDNLQVFQGSDGISKQQAVWLKPTATGNVRVAK